MSTTKISRKDIAKMSFADFLRAAKEPYRRLFSYLRPYRSRFSLGIVFGALFGATQGLLMFDIKFVGGAVFPDSDSKVSPTIVKWFPQLTDLHFKGAGLGTVLVICATIPLLMSLRGIFSYLNSYCMLWCSVRVLDDIRQDVFKHTLGQSMEFFNKAKAGDLVQTVFNQTRMAQQALTTIAGDVVKQPIAIVVGLVSMFAIDWKFTLASFLIFPLCLVPVVLVAKKVRKAGAREEEEAGQLMVIMQEAFNGIRVVKTHAREEFEAERFNRANSEIMRHIMRWRKAMEMSQPAVETVSSLGIAAALLWATQQHLKFNEFMALNAGMVMLYPAFKAMSRIYLMMQKCLASTTKVFELLDRQPAVQDAPNAKTLGTARGDIRFEGVHFSYGSDKAAVHGVDLVISNGSTCALVGASGAGKTTMLALLQRLYDVQQGRVTIDGLDIREVTQASLRKRIATVNQDVFLFHDSIANNIRYGRIDATEAEIEAAAKQAFAHDFILAQPHGYETVIGDKGCLLSGGQQQRLSIARALLKNAPILLLDEAMSALDSESEKQVQKAIDALAEGRTVVAIAHRLSTILHADQIVVMEHGRILDVGHHSELYSRSPVYRRLYDLQFNQPTLAPAESDALPSMP
jgi:subfamily B ATP-binding cassette protein MsbA